MYRLVIGFLIVLTGLSSLQIAFAPRLPASKDPELDLSGIPGAQAAPMEELPSRQTLNWSLSQTRRYSFRFQPDSAATSVFSLWVTGVKVRRVHHLQLALVTQDNPNLDMDQRRVHQTTDGNEYATGTIGGRDALQTCEVPSGRSGVTQETLLQLTHPKPFYRRNPATLLGRLAGLQPDRYYECVLITLISPGQGQGDDLVEAWRKVRQASTDQVSIRVPRG